MEDNQPQSGGMQTVPVATAAPATAALKFNITGTTLPALQIHLMPGQRLMCESGAMSWMTNNVKMDTKMKGLGSVISRLLVRESLFLNQFDSSEGEGVVAFTPRLPGNIVPIQLSGGRTVVAQKDAWLCAEESVKVGLTIQTGILRGLFGGEGFIMQKLSGNGTVFLEVDGSVIERDLKEGEVVFVDQGNIGAFEGTVKYRLTAVRGILNWFFSGEGLFITKLTGPGKIWLQSLPASRLSKRLLKKVGGGCASFIGFVIILFYIFTIIGSIFG